MIVIQALKQLRLLEKKIEKNQEILAAQSASRSVDIDDGQAKEKTKRVSTIIQENQSYIREYEELTLAIHRSNTVETVSIEINGRTITRTVDEWMTRRFKTLDREIRTWSVLTDRRIKTEAINKEGETILSKAVLHFSEEGRDKRLQALMEERSLIDSSLEIHNATTELK